MFTLRRKRPKTFSETVACPYGCPNVATINTDSAHLLSEWADSYASYHAECKPIGMCSREELEHALLWRYPANQLQSAHEMESK